MLEEDDALAAETAGEEDEDAARLEGVAGAGGVYGFADLEGGCQWCGWVDGVVVVGREGGC